MNFKQKSGLLCMTIETVMITIISAICGIIFCPFTLIMIVTCWLHSWITSWMLRPLHLEKMKGMDACMAHYPDMIVMKNLILSGLPQMDVIRSKLLDIVQICDENGNLRFRKLCQIMEKHYGLWYWKTCTRFHLDDHIHQYNAVAPSNENELKNVLGAIHAIPLRYDIPKWEITLIPLQGDFLTYGMASSVVFRYHHSIADGFTFMKLLTSHLGDDQIDYEPNNFLGNAKKSSKLHQMFMFLYAMCSMSRLSFRGRIPERNLLHGPKLNKKDYISWAVYDLDCVKDIKNATKTTVSDVLLSCLVGAIRKYFISKNSTVPSNISCLVPMGRYKPHTQYNLENYILLLRLCLSIAKEDSLERLQATKRAFSQMKTSPDIIVHQLVVRYMLPYFPRMLLDWIVMHTKAITIGTSSLTGPNKDIRLFGQQIIVTQSFQPHNGLMGINIVFHGQMDKLCVGLNADTAIIKCQEDLDMIITYFTKELEELHKQVLKGPTPKMQIPYSELNNQQCSLSIVIGH